MALFGVGRTIQLQSATRSLGSMPRMQELGSQWVHTSAPVFRVSQLRVRVWLDSSLSASHLLIQYVTDCKDANSKADEYFQWRV